MPGFLSCCFQAKQKKKKDPEVYLAKPEPSEPTTRACFQCEGKGQVHRSGSTNHPEERAHCKDCEGCEGSGQIPSNAEKCSKCSGEGRVHHGSSPHHHGECFGCKSCEDCAKKGWVIKTDKQTDY